MVHHQSDSNLGTGNKQAMDTKPTADSKPTVATPPNRNTEPGNLEVASKLPAGSQFTTTGNPQATNVPVPEPTPMPVEHVVGANTEDHTTNKNNDPFILDTDHTVTTVPVYDIDVDTLIPPHPSNSLASALGKKAAELKVNPGAAPLQPSDLNADKEAAASTPAPKAPKGSYRALRSQYLIMKDGKKVLPTDGYYVPANDEQKEMLKYYAELDTGLVELVK